MRGFTRPPGEQGSFREKKWADGSSRAQYPRTLDYTTDSVPNVGTVQTAYSLPIPAKYISGQGDSILFRFAGTTAATGDPKSVRIYLGSTNIFSVLLGSGVAYEWAAIGEIFGTNTTNQGQKSYTSFLISPSDLRVGVDTATENLNQDSVLEVEIEGVSPGDITFSLGKVEFSPAPPPAP